ncbi:MAG: hypothetical protein GWM90_11310 [Gemmatimonadetes bacterium]|nr:hypothetical protein [Gemmatimonadota bacterium]NIQ54572.1 hypothetical protein [Gemmatimonadota bacterium]NIU74775.1 hypothetical protein [Gammaproteobacteria bacterium]NIX44681.1 hypothetical protein [Gemmatimonadota bacterium]NIY08916.1 hypothetical protein [Gemmatimonadota bacterium]
MGVLTRASAALALLTLAACDSAVEPMVDFRLVHGVLLAGTDSVHIRLERAEPDLGLRSSIDDAAVTLELDDETLALPWAPGLPCVDSMSLPIVGITGCYRTGLDAPLAPGVQARLFIELPGEAPVLGHTRIPLPTTVVVLEEPWLRYPLSHPYVPVRLRWEAGPDVGRIEARLSPLGGHERGGDWHAGGCRIALDGAFVHDPRDGDAEIRLRDVGCPFDWDSLAVEVRSTAYDTAYARYHDLAGPSSLGTRATLVAAGVDGALGVFGAAVTAVDSFHILREPPPQ